MTFPSRTLITLTLALAAGSVACGGPTGDDLEVEFDALSALDRDLTRVEIPDADPAGIERRIVLDLEDEVVVGLRVVALIEHTYRGDLKVALRSPSGTQVVLHDREGANAPDLRLDATIFEAFAGEPATGPWTLTVSDHAAWDVGALLGWAILVQSEPVEVNPCARMLCPQGTTCEVRQVECVRAPCPPIGECVPVDVPPRGPFCGTRGREVYCGVGEYCHHEVGEICGWADAPGECRARPDFCTEQYQPVCGCDQQTYGNACAANQAGVSVQHDGPCEVRWQREAVRFDTGNPYENAQRDAMTFDPPVSSERVKINFTRFDTERGYDFVILRDAEGAEITRYHGALGAFETEVDVPGGTFTIEFTSDSSITRAGVAVDWIEWAY